ncbi:MAG: hypothetical protein ACYC5O_00760 [Anaerolineae bacterium]
MTARYAATTEVSSDRSLAEIKRTLTRYGAIAFVYGEKGTKAVVGFELGGRRYRIVLPLPARSDKEFTLTPARRQRRSADAAAEAWEQATRQKWRALALWIKATLEAAESGITTVETALLPFVVLPSGVTVGEWVGPQIEATYRLGAMPQLLPGLPAGEG